MSSMFQEREAPLVYSTDQDLNSGLSTEKVQGMANSIYSEFQRMMSLYGEDVIKELMPLVVTILEALDRSLTECNENAVEIEMLKDDNEQLATQFDRERQLRRTAEQQYMESEDHNETATRDLRAKADHLETTTRHLELKCKNYTDQVERLQERETELKREFSILHDRHTVMIQNYMDLIERTKVLQQQQSYTELSQSPRNKKDLPLVGNTPSPGDSPSLKTFTPDSNRNLVGVEQGSVISTPGAAGDQSHMSLKEELPKSAAATPVTTPASEHRSIVSTQEENVEMEVCSPSGESEAQGWVSDEVQEMLQNGELDLEPPNPNDASNAEGMESTGIENAAFDKTHTTNEDSLYAELSQQDIGDVDEGADILALFESGLPFAEGILQDSGFGDYEGMSKEVQNLINENTKLLATKNALNVVKDDLIQQVDQLTTQHTLLKEELTQSAKSKCELQEKMKDLEKHLNVLQQELDNVASGNPVNSAVKPPEEEEVVPLSQRKRFTRVEMARVLMERNQYKERLMELQEAVRWTETLRASRAHPDVNQAKTKNKSTIFQFFSRLFTSNSSDSTSPPSSDNQLRPIRRSMGSADLGLSMSYNVPTSKVMPRSRSTQMSSYGRSPTIDTLREEPTTKPETPKREIQAKMVDSRFQACGWSLPNSPATPKEGSRTVPVPVFCGPMFDAEPTMKLWCATAVNMSDGHTKDGGSIVGSGSVFYDTRNDYEGRSDDNKDMKRNSPLAELDKEIETETSKIQLGEKYCNALSSFVWLVASDARASGGAGGNTVHVMDACEPNRCIDKFSVGSNDTNILCITSIPGAEVEDYSNPDSIESESLTSRTPSHTTKEQSLSGDSLLSGGASKEEEVAMEATEDLTAIRASKKIQIKGVTEHIFTDPGSIHPTTTKRTVTLSTSESPKKIGGIEKVQSPIKSTDSLAVEDLDVDVQSGLPPESSRLASLQPTMWLGAQNGYVFVHSAITNWRKCLHQIRLKDSVLAIVHVKGRALTALADGTVAFFRRNDDGVWDLSNYHLLDLGRPHHSIRCMAVVYDQVWCAYRNKIHIVEPKSMKLQSSFDAHPRRESQVRQLAWAGDGVWISIRLDSTVRLYHARTLQHLQDVDVEPYVSKVLGSGKLGFSFVRITSLMISNHRLWIGTGNGVVMSVPLSEGAKTSTSAPVLSSSVRERPGGVVRVYSDPVSEKITPGTFIPYCSMANAQLSFHGYRDAVKFFVAVPGCVTLSSPHPVGVSPPKSSTSCAEGTLVLSGGEGYVDFRKGDFGALSPEEKKVENAKMSQGSQNANHVIVWQLTHP